jgi:hypothetical protein
MSEKLPGNEFHVTFGVAGRHPDLHSRMHLAFSRQLEGRAVKQGREPWSSDESVELY